MKTANTSNAYLKNQYHFRIIPQKITKSGKNALQTDTNLLFYLQKGMQVIGKSTKLVVPALESEIFFPVSKNLFDFQITNEKKMQYTWSLYKVDSDDYEERVEDVTFSIEKSFGKFREHAQNNNFDLTTRMEKYGIQISYKILIQNTADTIMKLTSAILPEVLPAADTNPPSNAQGQQEKANPEQTPEEVVQSKPQEQQPVQESAQQVQPQQKEIKIASKPKPVPKQAPEQKVSSQKSIKSQQQKKASGSNADRESKQSREKKSSQSSLKNKYDSMDEITNSLIAGNEVKGESLSAENEQIAPVQPATTEEIKQPTQEKTSLKKIGLLIVILFLAVGFIGAFILPEKSTTQKQQAIKKPKKKKKSKK